MTNINYLILYNIITVRNLDSGAKKHKMDKVKKVNLSDFDSFI